jgi:hypothetical protein
VDPREELAAQVRKAVDEARVCLAGSLDIQVVYKNDSGEVTAVSLDVSKTESGKVPTETQADPNTDDQWAGFKPILDAALRRLVRKTPYWRESSDSIGNGEVELVMAGGTSATSMTSKTKLPEDLNGFTKPALTAIVATAVTPSKDSSVAPETQAVFLRVRNPIHIFDLPFAWKDQQLRRIDAPLFVFDGLLDILVVGGLLLVTRAEAYQIAFGVEEGDEEVAKSALDSLTNLIAKSPPADEVAKYVKDHPEASVRLSNMSRRLATEGPFDDRRLGATIAGYGLALEHTQGRVELGEPETWDDAFHLVDDSFLTSQLTHRKYLATAKRDWNRRLVAWASRKNGVIEKYAVHGSNKHLTTDEILQDITDKHRTYVTRDRANALVTFFSDNGKLLIRCADGSVAAPELVVAERPKSESIASPTGSTQAGDPAS